MSFIINKVKITRKNIIIYMNKNYIAFLFVLIFLVK